MQITERIRRIIAVGSLYGWYTICIAKHADWKAYAGSFDVTVQLWKTLPEPDV